MNWIVQQPNVGTCMCCVAASLTDTTVENVFEFLGYGFGNFKSERIFDYLATKGIRVGYGYNILKPIRNETGKIVRYTVEVSITQPAFVVATPPELNSNHACYWDGANFWDPHYSEPVDNLHEYEIWSWTPLHFNIIGPPEPTPKTEAEKGYRVSPGGTVEIFGPRIDKGFPGYPFTLSTVVE